MLLNLKLPQLPHIFCYSNLPVYDLPYFCFYSIYAAENILSSSVRPVSENNIIYFRLRPYPKTNLYMKYIRDKKYNRIHSNLFKKVLYIGLQLIIEVEKQINST